MKRYLLTLLICLPFFSHAQLEMKYSYLFNAPQGIMLSSLDNAHGFSIDYYGSVKKSNYYTGLSFNLGVYGFHSEPIDFKATDGSVVKTNLNITNSYNSWSVYHKFRFSKFGENGGRLIPFIEARTGWAFFRTNLFIEDPEDETNCEALEQDIMQKDNTWNLYGGAGFDLLLTGWLNPEKHASCSCPRAYFSVSVGYNYGGKVNYMNVDKENTNSSATHNHSNHTSDGDQVPYYTTWINNQTQVTHQHHTGFLYTSAIRLIELKLGFTIRF